MPTANEQFRDALVRHQMGLLRVAGSLRRRMVELLDASEAELRDRAERAAARLSPADVSAGTSTAGGRRLAALEDAVASLRRAAVGRAMGAMEEGLLEVALAEPAFVADAARRTVPVILDVVLPPPSAVKSLLRTDPFQGKTLREWASTVERADLDRLRTQVRLGVVQGDTPAQLSRRLVGSASLRGSDGATEVTRRQADAVSRTAVTHFSNESRRLTHEANADIFEEEAYVATLDSRTSTICASLDGRRYPVGKGPRPPMHINCRSLRVAVIGGELIGDRPVKPTTERELLAEFARREGIDPVRSRDALPRGTKASYDQFQRRRVRELTGQAPAKTTYAEFLKRQSPAFQEEVLGKTKARLFREGGLPLDRFVARDGTELSLEQLRQRDSWAFEAAGL